MITSESGLYYIEYINNYRGVSSELIQKHIKNGLKHKNMGVQMKYRWLKQKWDERKPIPAKWGQQ
jgi:hypothetical protein